MRTHAALLSALLAFGLSTPALAGEQSGTITYLIVRASDGLIYFALNGDRLNPPPCATNAYWMIRDENSNVGKQQYAALLAAQASGRPIRVIGMNTCVRWGDGEDVDVVALLE